MPTMIRDDSLSARIAEELLGNIITIPRIRKKTANRRKKRR